MAVSSKTIDSFIQSFNRENTGLNSKSKTTADQNTKARLLQKKQPKKMVMIPKTFMRISDGLEGRKLNILESVLHYLQRKYNSALPKIEYPSKGQTGW